MSSGRVRQTRAGLVLAMLLFLGWGCWMIFRPRATLAEAVALAEGRQLDLADTKIRGYLRENPQSNGGNLLFAQIQLGLAEQHATVAGAPDSESVSDALAHLKLVHPDDRKMAALVLLSQGKAEYYLSQFDQAEASWNEALTLEPTIPVAGWSLLDLYYLEGRKDEAARLALRLSEVEPDPHDRVQLLLELVRQDAQPPAPASIAQWFEPKVRQNPGDLRGNLALGAALVRDGKTDRGLKILETMVEQHPDRPEAWEGWLTGLDDANQVGVEPLSLLVQATARLPSALAASPQFARFHGRVAQEKGDVTQAVKEYRRAAAAAPRDDRVDYRLIAVLRQSGAVEEAKRREHDYHTRLSAGQEVRPLFIRANGVKTLGTEPHPELYQELASLRERMGLLDEARAWHRIVLRDDPNNAVSRAALERLKDPTGSPGEPSPNPVAPETPRPKTPLAQHAGS